MAPTICSDKKQLRVTGLKEARRHHGVVSTNSASTSSLSSSSSTTTTSSSSTTTTTASSSSSMSSSSPARAAANRAVQASSVLRHVAKGSINPSGRRRFVRMPRKMPQISFKDDDDTSSDYTSISAIQETLSRDRASLDEYMHSSDSNSSSLNTTSSSIDSGNSSTNNNNNIRSVLQPAMGNNNHNNKNNNCNSNKSFDYDDSPMDEYVDDSDSGYDVTPAPRSMVKSFQQHHHQPNFQPQVQQPQNAEGLLSIAIKTIKLVQRNRLLQKRLAQLQLETSEFIASVLANPENSHFHHSKAEAKLSNMLLRH
ncbi:putative uncharacterized protein DDB_G0277255 [Drosophila tropicalis]|uniref:putative uncharacterized protein DDB_G0277255 n=1 Tax=Drosophila tropicalis TaxID=46794 RepID=UPI0035ABABF4